MGLSHPWAGTKEIDEVALGDPMVLVGVKIAPG